MTDQPQDLQAHHEEENQLIAQRKAKLAAAREQGIAFPNDFRRDSLCADLQKAYEGKSKEELESRSWQTATVGSSKQPFSRTSAHSQLHVPYRKGHSVAAYFAETS